MRVFPIHLQPNKLRFLCVALLCLFLTSPKAHADEWGMNFYGFSYHETRSYSDSEGRETKWNEVNPGVGLNHVFHQKGRIEFFHEEAFYQDSQKRTAWYVIGGGKYRFAPSFQLGAATGGFTSSNLANYGLGFLFIASWHQESVIYHLAIPLKHQVAAFYVTFKLE